MIYNEFPVTDKFKKMVAERKAQGILPKPDCPPVRRHHDGFVRNEYEQQMNADFVQIIPANGWRLVYLCNDDGELEIKPLVCWAIYDDEDHIGREIRACVFEDGRVVVVDTSEIDYLGIFGPGQRMPISWKRQIRVKRKRLRNQGSTTTIADKVCGKNKRNINFFKEI